MAGPDSAIDRKTTAQRDNLFAHVVPDLVAASVFQGVQYVAQPASHLLAGLHTKPTGGHRRGTDTKAGCHKR